jgi:hypothetical protein
MEPIWIENVGLYCGNCNLAFCCYTVGLLSLLSSVKVRAKQYELNTTHAPYEKRCLFRCLQMQLDVKMP